MSGAVPRRRGAGDGVRRSAAVLALALLLAGCSAMPGALDPVEWFKSARDAVDDDAETRASRKAAERAKEMVPPDEDKPFPRLSTVPERPRYSSAEERQRAADSLTSDRENARYTDEVIRRQTDSPSPRQPPPTRPERTSTRPQASPPALGAAPPPPALAPAPAVKPPPPSLAPSPAVAPQPNGPGGATSSSGNPPAAPEARRVAARGRPSAGIDTPARPGGGKMPPGDDAKRPAAPAFGAPPPDIQVARQGRAAGRGPAASAERSPGPPTLTFGAPPPDIQAVQGRVAARAGAPAAQRAAGVMGARPPAGVDPGAVPTTRPVAVVRFADGSAELTRAARQELSRVSRMHRAEGGTLRIVGYAGVRGTETAGLPLQRAAAVARELIRLGVAPAAVSVGGMPGGGKLRYDAAGRAEPRADIFLIRQG